MTSTVAAPRPAYERDDESSTTAPEEQPLGRLRRAMWGRRLLILLLVLVVVAGLIGLLGVRTRTAEASGGGYTLQVHYASIARPGVSVPFSIEVTSDDGFDGPIELAVSASYLDTLDVHTMSPEPSSSTADDAFVVMQFDPPNGDVLEVSWSAQVDPSADMGGRDATIAVLEEDTPVTSLSISTFLLP